MTATVRVVVEVTKTYVVDVDPDLYGEDATIPAADLVDILNDGASESYELIPGGRAYEGEIDVDCCWRAPREFEVSS